MKIAIGFSELFHYHVARYRTLNHYAKTSHHEVLLLAMRSGAPDLPTGKTDASLVSCLHVIVENPAADLNTNAVQIALYSFLAKHQPDAVLIPGYSTRYTRTMLRWCRSNKAGAVLMSDSRHEGYRRNPLKEWLKRKLVKQFDAAFVAGKPQARYAERLGIPACAIRDGFDVVDNDFWHRQTTAVRKDIKEWQKNLNLPAYYFLSVSRFVDVKNIIGLIEAYSSYVTSSLAPWHLVLVGGGSLETKVRNLIRQKGLSHLVHLPGFLSADQLVPYYALASGFILASYAETWGLVVNEAMASELPILISNNIGCVEDLLISGQTGWTFNPDDPRDISRAMQKLSNLDEASRQQLGSNAWRQIQKFSLDYFAANAFELAEISVANAQKRRSLISPSLFWI